jgi:hypothetical protein
MIYRVRYGKHFLKAGGLSHEPRIFAHPSAARRAIEGFEKRFPNKVGHGVIEGVRFGKVVENVPLL